MELYEIKLRDNNNGVRWSVMFRANNFGHAEEQAVDYIVGENDEIIAIVKDFENATI